MKLNASLMHTVKHLTVKMTAYYWLLLILLYITKSQYIIEMQLISELLWSIVVKLSFVSQQILYHLAQVIKCG